MNNYKRIIMQPFAYGASLHDNDTDSELSEMVTMDNMSIRIAKFPKNQAIDKIIKYHHKCIQLALDNDIIDEIENKRVASIDHILTDIIKSIYNQYLSTKKIFMHSRFVDDMYLKHCINLPNGSEYFIHLFMLL